MKRTATLEAFSSTSGPRVTTPSRRLPGAPFATDKADIRNLPFGYTLVTDGSTIDAIPNQYPDLGVTLSKKTGQTDIGPLLRDLIVNELPPQGTKTEATGTIYLKRGYYPGKLSNASEGYVLLPTHCRIRGEMQSHQDPDDTSSAEPAQNMAVLMDTDGDAFGNPDVNSDLTIWPELSGIAVQGPDDGTGTFLKGAGSNTFDWGRFENLVAWGFDTAHDGITSIDAPTIFRDCFFFDIKSDLTLSGRQVMERGAVLLDSGATINLSKRAGLDTVRIKGVDSSLVNATQRSFVQDCGFQEKAGGTAGNGDARQLEGKARAEGNYFTGTTWAATIKIRNTGSWPQALNNWDDSGSSPSLQIVGNSSISDVIVENHIAPDSSTVAETAQNPVRPRWNGVIWGGPFGGADIGSLTGASEGDIARSDGTNASASADELFIQKASGDWQSIADPSTTITPS